MVNFRVTQMRQKRLFLKKAYRHTLELLPHEIRFRLNKCLMKSSYLSWQELRKKDTTGNEESLKGFDELQCIFVHIPKTAGVSVCRALFGNLAGSHRTIYEYSLIFNKKLFNTYYKFTFVRNPWDRLLSAYLFLKEGGLHNNDALWAAKELQQFKTFDEFVKNWVNKTNIGKGIHFVPQYKFITIGGKIAVNDVYKMENINRDFQRICKKLNIHRDLPILNKTKSKTGDYKKYYNKETRNIVGKVYEKDVEIFKYEF